MSGIDKIDDAHTGLARVFAVKTASMLLQRALPRDRHRQRGANAPVFLHEAKMPRRTCLVYQTERTAKRQTLKSP
jgi:hypothetical protein